MRLSGQLFWKRPLRSRSAVSGEPRAEVSSRWRSCSAAAPASPPLAPTGAASRASALRAISVSKAARPRLWRWGRSAVPATVPGVAGAPELAAAGGPSARACLALAGRRRYHCSSGPPCPQPKAADRLPVLPPSTGSHASAGPTGGRFELAASCFAARRWHRQSGAASALRRAWLARWHLRRRRVVARVGRHASRAAGPPSIRLARVPLRSWAVEPTAAGRP